MKTYTVHLTKTVEYETTLTVEADSKDEAEELAVEESEDMFSTDWDEDFLGGNIFVDSVEEEEEEEDEVGGKPDADEDLGGE
jgi:hypothetical protein